MSFRGYPTPLPKHPNASGEVIRTILVEADVRGKRMDVLFCGHVHETRASLLPTEYVGARRCHKCESDAPVDVDYPLKLDHAERMRKHWEWWAGTGREILVRRRK